MRGAILVAAVGLAAGCSEPTKPTPIDPGAPTLSCPAAPNSIQALDASGAVVVFGAASANGGAPPLTTPSCTAASGTKFPVGTTTVTCTVSDAKARSAAPCSFEVVVTPPPIPSMLAVTQFLAFGDSMTAGEVVSEGYGPPGCFGAVSTATPTVLRPLKIDLTVAYPTDLQSSLRRRYTTQSATVQNVGCQGETTAEGLVRLSTVLASASQAQALLLLEGVNDISGGSPFITAAVRNVDAMIRLALSRKLRVIVGTLPPQNAIAPTGSGESCVSRNSGADFVTPFNSALKLMVASEGVPVADIYEAFNGNVSMLIDCDGLHPTAAGYQTISDTFFNTIAKNFETSPTTTATPTFAPRVDRTRRR